MDLENFISWGLTWALSIVMINLLVLFSYLTFKIITCGAL